LRAPVLWLNSVGICKHSCQCANSQVLEHWQMSAVEWGNWISKQDVQIRKVVVVNRDFGSYIRNAGTMEWVFTWRRCVTQRLSYRTPPLPSSFSNSSQHKFQDTLTVQQTYPGRTFVVYVIDHSTDYLDHSICNICSTPCPWHIQQLFTNNDELQRA
jgi:hypothetical protein